MTSCKVLLVLSMAFVTLGGTTTGDVQTFNDSTVTEATAKQIAGHVPLPQGTGITQQDSLVMGSGTAWTGQLNGTVTSEPQQV